MKFWNKKQRENTDNFKRKYMYWITCGENIFARYKNVHVENKYNSAKNDDYIKCSENIYARYKNRYREGLLGH